MIEKGEKKQACVRADAPHGCGCRFTRAESADFRIRTDAEILKNPRGRADADARCG